MIHLTHVDVLLHISDIQYWHNTSKSNVLSKPIETTAMKAVHPTGVLLSFIAGEIHPCGMYTAATHDELSGNELQWPNGQF